MHGDSAVHFAGLHHFFHLLVAFIFVSHLDGGDAFGLQGADVVHIHALLGGHQRGFHGVLLAVLTAHTGQCDLGLDAEGTAFQTFCHLQEGLGNGLFQIHHGCHLPYSA